MLKNYPPTNKGRKKRPGFTPKHKRKTTQAQMAAFYMLTGAKSQSGGDMYPAHDYIAQPEVRYEFDGESIYREVDALHYISSYTFVNGQCRSFNQLNGILLLKKGLTGKEILHGANDRVLEIFHKRYYVGRHYFFDTGDSDLNRRIRGYRIIINEYAYFIVQVQNLLDDDYSPPRLFRGKDQHQPSLNPFVPISPDLPEIIEDLSKLKYIDHYGDPKKCHSPEKVIEFLKGKLSKSV